MLESGSKRGPCITYAGPHQGSGGVWDGETRSAQCMRTPQTGPDRTWPGKQQNKGSPRRGNCQRQNKARSKRIRHGGGLEPAAAGAGAKGARDARAPRRAVSRAEARDPGRLWHVGSVVRLLRAVAEHVNVLRWPQRASRSSYGVPRSIRNAMQRFWLLGTSPTHCYEHCHCHVVCCTVTS
ncbi:LADA_0H07162g1_1 [Lachancea dasiensis]|uniref:LADA_0H07162g1_1 n=1 Tax=Lachancea dasiensis TaxID=1072105 RepID=A0A1G4K1Z6_9SACH|nr:LADA_0H07162g1_1 [Lachancea dasiensis]